MTPEIIPTLTTQAKADAYLKTLKPGAWCASIAASFAANCAIVFGVSDKERAIFSPDKIEVLEWLHEGYHRGEWNPVPGSDASFFVLLAEHYAGGKPRLEQRTEVLRACLMHVMGTMRKGKAPFLAGDQPADPKRRKVLDDLDKCKEADDEPWEEP